LVQVPVCEQTNWYRDLTMAVAVKILY